MKPTKSSDVIIKVLLDLIMKGEIRPGDKVPSAENLAKNTGTSVISAREAVQNLAGIGLVEIMHGRGIFLTEGPGNRRTSGSQESDRIQYRHYGCQEFES